MNTKLTLILLTFLIIGFNSFAQETAFRVLASKGINTSNGSALRVGSKITNDQSIEVGTSAYLGLAHIIYTRMYSVLGKLLEA